MCMSRTNIDIDDELIAKVMRIYRVKTKKAAVELALRRMVSDDPHRGMLALRGSGWDGDEEALRSVPEEW